MRKVLLLAAVLGSTPTLAAPLSTPPGITLVEVARELTLSQPDILWVRPGDEAGRTLFTTSIECVDACAKEWLPLTALPGSKAQGDWTLTKRPDGAQQWAYQGKALYTWTKEQEPGDVAINVGLTEASGAKLAERVIRAGQLMPPKEWTVVRFTPENGLAVPAGITAKLANAATGVILTDFRGNSLYAYDGDPRRDNQTCSEKGCDMRWQPVTAADFAKSVGDFTIVARADGSSQWAWKKQPLYRFSGDLVPGDVLGGAVDKHWKLAALTENYAPAKVAVSHIEAYGNSLTVNGMTLYGGYAAQKRWGGRNTRDGFRNSWSKGMRLGVEACDHTDAKCLAEWRPFTAPANAHSQGFWQVYNRPDGTKQWAYKGYALWTKATDKQPGDITGQLTYDYARLGGDDATLERMAFLDKVGGDLMYGGAGIYWSLARP